MNTRTITLIVTALAAVLIGCTIAVIITITVSDKQRAEQAFTQCVQDGYAARTLDEKLAIRDRCEGLLP